MQKHIAACARGLEAGSLKKGTMRVPLRVLSPGQQCVDRCSEIMAGSWHLQATNLCWRGRARDLSEGKQEIPTERPGRADPGARAGKGAGSENGF